MLVALTQLFDDRQDLAEALHGVVLALHRNQDFVAHRHGEPRDAFQGWWAVDQNDVKVPAQTAELSPPGLKVVALQQLNHVDLGQILARR